VISAPDPGSCRVTLDAAADGGEDGTYAMWGEVIARITDPDTGVKRMVPHPFGQGSVLFGADRIKTGQSQSGEIDLECFRGTPGQEVSVELEIQYTIMEKGAPVEGDDSIRLDLECR
jgi:hypothetical protein